MNRGRSRKRLISSALLAGLAAASLLGCGSSHQLVDVWKDPVYPKEPMKNVLVLALKRDPTIRRLWEDDFVAALAQENVKATPSYRLFPAALPDTDEVQNAVDRDGYDGVIATVTLPSRTESQYVPGTVTREPVVRYGHWLHTFYTTYHDVYQPGYVENERVVRNRTDVWSPSGDGRMIWSGTSEVIDPTARKQVKGYVVGMVVPDLVEKGVIPGSGK